MTDIHADKHPDPRLRLAVHPADRAPRARGRRLQRDPRLGRPARDPRFRAGRRHPVRRPGVVTLGEGRRAPRTRCSSSACRCSASATACRPWPRSSAARWSSSDAPRVRLRRGAITRATSRLLDDIEDHATPTAGLLDVWMSHGDRVERAAAGLHRDRRAPTARRWPAWPTRRAASTACSSTPRSRTPAGHPHPERFVHDICGCAATGPPATSSRTSIARSASRSARQGAAGLSGGVDSSVVAALLHRAIGDQLVCVFVDHGLLRSARGRPGHGDLRRAHGRQGDPRRTPSERFLARSPASADPEEKRKIIGRLFIEVFEEEAQKLEDVDWLAQGTIYPDVIESAGAQDRQGARDQVAPQRRRPARAHEAEAGRAAARAVQGRGAQASASSSACRATWSTATRSRARASACASSARCARSTPSCCAGRRIFIDELRATTSTTRSARPSPCSCRCARSA
jgi:hypothetical protein